MPPRLNRAASSKAVPASAFCQRTTTSVPWASAACPPGSSPPWSRQEEPAEPQALPKLPLAGDSEGDGGREAAVGNTRSREKNHWVVPAPPPPVVLVSQQLSPRLWWEHASAQEASGTAGEGRRFSSPSLPQREWGRLHFHAPAQLLATSKIKMCNFQKLWEGKMGGGSPFQFFHLFPKFPPMAATFPEILHLQCRNTPWETAPE
ncbi:hypothetical protein JRQ81_011982 [Phrynocephalus forsythii]|uniref:Uncharacterized protein n=1 Tax=Phrynocephalus forsythii TaxID=171643 RepID=A0A9Q1AQM7_9SAUR|nr:hypothetical protein JRQ81_011982 [Phrynocephalus forsythii]